MKSMLPLKLIRGALGTRGGLIANLVTKFFCLIPYDFLTFALHRFILRPVHGNCRYLQATKAENPKSTG